jgi:hypothetical protein
MKDDLYSCENSEKNEIKIKDWWWSGNILVRKTSDG